MDNFEGWFLITILWAVFTTIFWMAVAWRAMRAHEKLADSIEWLARQQSPRRERPDNTLNQD